MRVCLNGSTREAEEDTIDLAEKDDEDDEDSLRTMTNRMHRGNGILPDFP